MAIWDLPSDYYMHNLHVAQDKDSVTKQLTPITDWIRPIVLRSLPHSTSDSCKIVSEFIRVQSPYEEMVDCYANYYIPNRYTPFEEQIAFQIKSFRANSSNQDYSPFVPRKREVATTNPSLTGQSSTSSYTGSASSSCDDDQSSDDETQLGEVAINSLVNVTPVKSATFDSVLGSMKDVYGMELKRPSRESQRVYRTYVQTGKMAKDKVAQKKSVGVKSFFEASDYERLLNPQVASGDLSKYSNYLLVPEKFSKNTLDTNLDVLSRYINVSIE